jgi:uncharacterized OsmC-like protein
MATANAKLNGLDTKQLHGTVDAIKGQPSLARFQFRARNRWLGGASNETSIRDFYGAGREDDSRKTPFVYRHDEPPVLLGNNEGANPGETLLHALAGCVTSTLVIHAAARGIRIDEVSTVLTGDNDLRGFLGLEPAVPVAFEKIKVEMSVKADCSDEALDDLLAFTRAHSVVFQTISRPVPVVLERARKTERAAS